MTSNVQQYRHFDLRQAINFAVEPINNDGLGRRTAQVAGPGRLLALCRAVPCFPFLRRAASYLRLSGQQ